MGFKKKLLGTADFFTRNRFDFDRQGKNKSKKIGGLTNFGEDYKQQELFYKSDQYVTGVKRAIANNEKLPLSLIHI